MEEKLSRYERIILRVIIFAIIVLISAMLYVSCSAIYVKGSNNNIRDDAKSELKDAIEIDRSKEIDFNKTTIDSIK